MGVHRRGAADGNENFGLSAVSYSANTVAERGAAARRLGKDEDHELRNDGMAAQGS